MLQVENLEQLLQEKEAQLSTAKGKLQALQPPPPPAAPEAAAAVLQPPPTVGDMSALQDSLREKEKLLDRCVACRCFVP